MQEKIYFGDTVAQYRKKVNNMEMTPEEATAIHDLIETYRELGEPVPQIQALMGYSVDEIDAITKGLKNRARTVGFYQGSITYAGGELGSKSLSQKQIERIKKNPW